jgi:hypothetical protein
MRQHRYKFASARAAKLPNQELPDSIAAIKLFGRISTQFRSTYSVQASRFSGPNLTDQPCGTLAKLGHNEYWPSSFTRTRNTPDLSSNGFVTTMSP